MSFARIGRLLLPARTNGDLLQEADDRWDATALVTADPDRPFVWGRSPQPSGTEAAALVLHAWRRERALRPLRTAGVYHIHPWNPGQLRSGAVRNRFRSFVRRGVVVERVLETQRLIDEITEAAGVADRVEQFRVASGGVLHARVEVGHGLALLKIDPTGTTQVDPESSGLDRLQAAGIALVPRLLGTGHVDGMMWSVQSMLPGARPARVSRQLGRQVCDFSVQLPLTDEPHASVTSDARSLAEALPGFEIEILQAARVAVDRLAGVPSIFRHGDLWSANLLVDGGGLSGVVDWDAWHSNGVPGADLLHMVTREGARNRGRSYGGLWTERPWLSDEFSRMTAAYWRALEIQPDETTLEGIGVAWWLNQVSASISRLPRLAANNAWLEKNIVDVLSRIGG